MIAYQAQAEEETGEVGIRVRFRECNTGHAGILTLAVFDKTELEQFQLLGTECRVREEDQSRHQFRRQIVNALKTQTFWSYYFKLDKGQVEDQIE